MQIFDDNSSDGTWEILCEYAQKYDFVNIHQNQIRLGFNKNFEKALQNAQHDYIAIADQDDVWHLEKIGKMLENWHDEKVLLMYCNSVRFQNEVPKNPKLQKNYRRFGEQIYEKQLLTIL